VKPYYEAGSITIYHGDCRDILPALRPDLILTDPPYNVNLGKQHHSKRNALGGYANETDQLLASEYQQLIDAVVAVEAVKIVTPGVVNQRLWPPPLWTLAWIKANGITRTPLTRGTKMCHNCWEPILIYGKLDRPPNFDTLSHAVSMQREAEGHPCPKPYALFQRLLNFTDAQVVVDPFMGSGTTLREAKDLGRCAIGIETEEAYCEIAAQRLAQEVLFEMEEGRERLEEERQEALPL
jgi:site-specific DNA-methyltransferase (adenine-specific)